MLIELFSQIWGKWGSWPIVGFHIALPRRSMLPGVESLNTPLPPKCLPSVPEPIPRLWILVTSWAFTTLSHKQYSALCFLIERSRSTEGWRIFSSHLPFFGAVWPSSMCADSPGPSKNTDFNQIRDLDALFFKRVVWVSRRWVWAPRPGELHPLRAPACFSRPKNYVWPPAPGGGSLIAQSLKNLPVMQETPGWIPGSERSPGEGNGHPLQYSCLGDPMDRGAWRAIVHGVARVRHNLATKPPPPAPGYLPAQPYWALKGHVSSLMLNLNMQIHWKIKNEKLCVLIYSAESILKCESTETVSYHRQKKVLTDTFTL